MSALKIVTTADRRSVMGDQQPIRDSFKVGVSIGAMRFLVEGVGRSGMYAALLALFLLLVVLLIARWV